MFLPFQNCVIIKKSLANISCNWRVRILDKVSKVIDMTANNADKDCRNELKELQSLKGKQHSVELH